MADEAEPQEDRVVGPLRASRRPLFEGVHKLQVAAEAIDAPDARFAFPALETAMEYLEKVLLPINRAEEYTLYIAVDSVYGARGATEVMKAQHASIAAIGRDLGQVVQAARTDNDIEAYRRYFRPLLHGLYALVRAHLEAEDDAYLAVLDEHLSESQVAMIVDNTARVAAGSDAPEIPWPDAPAPAT